MALRLRQSCKEQAFLQELAREFFAAVLRHKQAVHAPALRDGDEDGSIEIGDDMVVGAAQVPPPLPAGSRSAELRAADLIAAEKNVGEILDQDEARASVIQKDLLALLAQQMQAVQRRNDEREQQRYKEMQYPLVALADEVFLNLRWPGLRYWNEHLLEEQVFNTHQAGTQFFENCDLLLRQRDPTRADVAAAYLLAIALGFRGQFEEVGGAARLQHYKTQLFALLFQRNPGIGDATRLFAQAYGSTLAGRPVQLLPQLRPWLVGMVVVAVSYVAIAHFIWTHGSARVNAAIADLRETQRTAPPPGALPGQGAAPRPADAKPVKP